MQRRGEERNHTTACAAMACDVVCSEPRAIHEYRVAYGAQHRDGRLRRKAQAGDGAATMLAQQYAEHHLGPMLPLPATRRGRNPKCGQVPVQNWVSTLSYRLVRSASLHFW